LIPLVFADVPNGSGIAARAAQHIVAVKQHIVDFSWNHACWVSKKPSLQIHISAAYDLSRIPRIAQAFLPFPCRHRTSI